MSVIRVHWLRARAQQGRWAEELILVQHEMKWTVAFYMHMAQVWKQHRSEDWGHRAYAEKQIAMWNDLGKVAETAFHNAYGNLDLSWEPVL
ncbi:hypothetical protein HYPSUDRAFT_152318 [Hypholoma sublateritium FD-334 SS-4]|uniref:Uncharacterized protein n=1 Tax=Hypholoma sublateritium (strain FD-334 SS-4) TaxID=945553 RepID=A0A0D2NVQ1_HYPSF|nr:hypothetical protein HYPSUDRAFT_152318 [Hypholoma sublateritium FD-334 SS-4]